MSTGNCGYFLNPFCVALYLNLHQSSDRTDRSTAMTGVKIICLICIEEFACSDDIRVTSCGHLYHHSCLLDWQNRSRSCSQCREENPTNHKVFLISETGQVADSNATVVDDLDIKLMSSIEKIEELQAQLEESELNFYHLQQQYTTEVDARKQLELKIAEFYAIESNFISLHAKFAESEHRLELLQEEIKCLSIQNEDKDTEIIKLRESLAKHPSSFEAKINVMEQRLTHIRGELQKEISNSTQLAIDKIKLQSYIQLLEMQTNDASVPSTHETAQSSTSFTDASNSEQVAGGRCPDVPERTINNRSVVIHGLPSKEMKVSLRKTLLHIATKMDVDVNEDDIEHVNVLDNEIKETSDLANVFVQFRTDELKLKFLEKINALKTDEVLGKVDIKEFIDPNVHTLYIYAKRNLYGRVFGHMCRIKNTIVANIKEGDSKDVMIRSRQQVDDLLETHQMAIAAASV